LSSGSQAVSEPKNTSRPRFYERLFSFPVAMAGLLVVLCVLACKARLDDLDMWWHLRMGQVVWTTHTVPITDIFSFTTNHHAWTPHEWLSQVTIYLFYRAAGLSGLMLWLCFFASAVLIAGYILCSLYSGNPKVGFAGALVFFLYATIGFSVRPQLIGYLLLLIELILIHLGRTRSPKWFWCFPPLFAIWINCHGSFFLGLLVIGAFIVSGFFDFRFGSIEAQHWDRRFRTTLILAFLLSLPALLLNPDGIQPIIYPLDTFLHQHIGLSTVDEWMPLQMTGQRGIFLLLTLAIIFLLVAGRKAQVYLHELILLAAGTWLAISHTRMVFVFGILAAPIFARMLADSWEDYKPTEDRAWPNAVLMALALLVAWWAFPNTQDLQRQVEETSPFKAVEYIRSHHLTGPMLNDYGFGGYLIWALPEEPVFVDGRGDVFEWSGVLEEFGNWAMLQSDPNTLLDKYHVHFCILGPHSPMSRILPTMPGWKTVYSDANAIIFERVTSVDAKP
jgi:hypothetical protein